MEREAAHLEKGNLILVRLSFSDEEGQIVEEKQFQGLIDQINDSEIVVKHPSTGEEVTLPAHRESYQKAEPGEYDLPSTGEKITNPDFITEWTLRVASAT